MGRFALALVAAMGVWAWAGNAASAPVSKPTVKPPPVPALSVPGERVQRISLRDMGAQRPLEFRGTDHSMYLPLSVRLDETVVSAKLKLGYTFSPALLPDLSMLKVMVNDESLATLVAAKGRLGSPLSSDVALDPRFFTEFTKLRLQFIGHYTLDCEFPHHTSLWANVSNESMLELVTRPLALRNDLALLPAPFFDARDSRRLVLPFVLAGKPAPSTVHSAAVLASWFGALASYRGAQFPVLQGRLPDRHGIVLATNDERPVGLNLPKVEVPTITVMAQTQNPVLKLLVLQGRDAAQLQQAVDGLVLGQAALTGERAEVKSLKYPRPREPYDGPRMAKTGTRIKLGELVPDPADLQVRGSMLNPIRVELRLPPDVFTWQSKGIPVDLRYRHTPPTHLGLASLSMRVNDQLVQSVLLQPASTASRLEKLVVPFAQGNTQVVTQSLTVPAFQLAARNQLDFMFDIPSTDEGRCRTTLQSGAQASVDPDSVLDLTGLEHYAALPNLGLYAAGGFPFTKYADLSQTVLVVPDAPQPSEIQAALEAAGHLGSYTGLAGIGLKLLPSSRIKEAGDRDLLLVSAGNDPNDPLKAWGQSLPARLHDGQRDASALSRIAAVWSEWFTGAVERVPPQDGWSELTAKGPLGAVIGFESPLAGDRSVVAISASQPDGLPLALNALLDAGKMRQIQGDLTLMRGDAVEAFRIGSVYHVGHLSWWRWLWYQFHQHPLVLALIGLLIGLIVALLLYTVLKQVAARRLSAGR
ncbi:MAG: cellulose biosynthesis cyclic di-GMP-binding regulatory protein BcsB [Burkholderiales bacterium]